WSTHGRIPVFTPRLLRTRLSALATASVWTVSTDHMNLTTETKPRPSTRRPVAGYLLASIVVGVVGLVTAISMTVSGILNSFSDVSESYIDIFDTGVEVGPQETPVD